MSSTTVVRYQTVESVYRGRKDGWHQYDYVHLVANENFLNGRQYAKVLSSLYVPHQQLNEANRESTIRGFFEVNFCIILDNTGAEVKPERVIWTQSDRIDIPANLDANDYPGFVTSVVDQSFRKRHELQDELRKIAEQKATAKKAAQKAA